MTGNPERYKRLSGKKKRFLGFGYDQLWLGSDHLLLLDSKYYEEDYKRFYFKDIQSLLVRKTDFGKIQNIFLGLIGGFFILIAVATDGGASIFFWVMSGLFFFVLLINTLRGPTCETILQTAVQTEKLLPLDRINNAQKTIIFLRPLIKKFQGILEVEAPKVDTSG
ncbi:hypothetical protein ACFL9U_04495 [Thermodesulfobacteriota bacterium]